jgi:hypothetical protein
MKEKQKIIHAGLSPAHRPPEEEPERVGEGELDEGPPNAEAQALGRAAAAREKKAQPSRGSEDGPCSG